MDTIREKFLTDIGNRVLIKNLEMISKIQISLGNMKWLSGLKQKKKQEDMKVHI